ncbi:AMP-binding protein [Streptosporangium soli]|nr:AMP-binding protein [Streptosporangium sp. KLBMP 9127]
MFLAHGARADPALVLPGGDDIRYGDLPRAMVRWSRLAGELPRKGLVALFADLSPDTVLCYLACLEAGHAVLLADPALSERAVARLLAAYEPELVVRAPGVPPEGYEARQDTTVWRRTSPAEHHLHDDLALLMMTSGTTGRPRAVRLSRINVSGNARDIVRALGMDAADRAVTSLPLHYCYGLSVLNSHLSCGAAVVLTDASPTGRRFLRLMAAEGVTAMAGVPLTYRALWPVLRREWPASLRSLTQAGGALPTAADYARLASARGARFSVMYGQTEATARMSVLDTAAHPDAIGSVGRAIPGGRFRIEDTGEIVYEGPNVMLGYADTREDLARGDRLHGVLRTGDVGTLRDGFLYLDGRLKRIVKVAGRRINLDEVESALAGIGEVAVVGSPEGMTAYCLADEARVRRHAATICAGLGIPPAYLRIQLTGSLPYTSTGKIDYQRFG